MAETPLGTGFTYQGRLSQNGHASTHQGTNDASVSNPAQRVLNCHLIIQHTSVVTSLQNLCEHLLRAFLPTGGQ